MTTTKVIKNLSVNLHLTISSGDSSSFTIHLKEGKLLLDTVRHFMDENNIPCYLEVSIMSVIESLMEESRRINLEKDAKITDKSVAQQVQKGLVAKYKKHTVRFNDGPLENIFPKAFHTLVHSPVPFMFDILSQLEQDYKNSIKEMMASREKDKAEIDESHQREVESMVESGSADSGFKKLVEMQVEESEFNQATWESELVEMQRNQKQEYCDFVLKLYEAHQQCLAEQQSSTDTTCISRLDGKEIVSMVIADMKKNKKVSKELSKVVQGNQTRSRPGSISSMSEVMLSTGLMTPQPPAFASPADEKKSPFFTPEDERSLSQIQEMGFSSEQAKAALEMTNKNIDNAIILLLEQTGKVDAHIQRRPSVPIISATKEIVVPHKRSKSNSKPLVLSVLKQEKKSPWSPMSFLQQQKSNGTTTPSSMKKFSWLVGKAMENFGLEDDETVQRHGPIMQFDEHQLVESFTISLGNQVKSTHNLRLLASDIDDLLKPSNDEARDTAYRAQTAASLYSQDLTAIVLLLTPRDWPKYKFGKSANKAFFKRCKESTEFHFDNVETQFEAIEKDFPASEVNGTIPVKEGDFFITKHSNLPLVHVAFHLVIDFESITKSELSGNSGVIIAEIDCFSGPSIPENVLYRRGEAVLNRIKGFMFENSCAPKSKDDKEEETKTVQFLLPKSATEQQFHSHRQLLIDIFRAN
ncbi:1901_t:CDS:10 [Dentiscutata erythropus]|uniref:1901_t:CDS:1 n=1 Tax=Dentiscutata erythropus TaxID=1348616 RepID=A0A9N9AEE7_9GLOM|nr:1901_t:CDS:10 [Dentiscutata erythropus]